MGFLEAQMMMMTTHHPYLRLEVAYGLTMCCPNELRLGGVESWKKTMCSDLLQWKRSPITPMHGNNKNNNYCTVLVFKHGQLLLTSRTSHNLITSLLLIVSSKIHMKIVQLSLRRFAIESTSKPLG